MKVNILHRPELAPEKMEVFRLQQEMVHSLGFKATVLATAPSLDDKECIALFKEYKANFGDEIGLSFHDLGSEELIALVGYQEAAFWMYDEADKKKVAEFLVKKFEEAMGFLPTSAASYHFDASSLRVLKEVCPTIKTVVGGCFEEGVRVFHGCNHSWYLFNEGMPWGPWYPSSSNALRPAQDEDDAAGVVAVPHLTRDMVLAYEGRNDFWASHPPNVQRGMGNIGDKAPYDKNLIDQHRYQERYNGGFSYLNIFVGPTWLVHNHNSEEAPEISVSLYRQQLEYLKQLESTGEADMLTMADFGSWYRDNVAVGGKEVFLAKELLYGSKKHYIWHIGPKYRVLMDLSQGCSIGDLRPYLAKINVETGRNSSHGVMGSYPYLIHSQHRTGYANHYLDGSRTTALLELDGEVIDLASISFSADQVYPDHKGFITNEKTVKFSSGAAIDIKTEVLFKEEGLLIRRIIGRIKGSEMNSVKLIERLKAGHGTTEYPEDMSAVQLSLNDEEKKMAFSYKQQRIDTTKASSVEASIPEVNTKVVMKPTDNGSWEGSVEDGILFSPFFTLALRRKLSNEDNISEICLQLKTID